MSAWTPAAGPLSHGQPFRVPPGRSTHVRALIPGLSGTAGSPALKQALKLAP